MLLWCHDVCVKYGNCSAVAAIHLARGTQTSPLRSHLVGRYDVQGYDVSSYNSSCSCSINGMHSAIASWLYISLRLHSSQPGLTACSRNFEHSFQISQGSKLISVWLHLSVLPDRLDSSDWQNSKHRSFSWPRWSIKPHTLLYLMHEWPCPSITQSTNWSAVCINAVQSALHATIVHFDKEAIVCVRDWQPVP